MKMEEEPGCIHYYTSQTDCRKGKEDNLSLLHMKRLPYIVAQNSLLCGAILIHLTSNICHCSYQLHLTTLVGLPLAISPHLQPLSTSPIFQPLEDWKIGRLERRREAAASTPPLASTTPGRSAFLPNNWCCRPSAKTPRFSHSSCTLHSTAKGNSQAWCRTKG